MADETNDNKVKQTVPALVRTAKGVAEHAQAVQDMQYDSERKAFRDPRTATLALFAYARLTASLLHETEERLAQANAKLKERASELEMRIAAIETWKADAERQGAEMAKGLEEMMAGSDGPSLDQLQAMLGGAKTCTCSDPAFPTTHTLRDHTLPRVESAAPAIASASTVVPIKPDKPNKKQEEKRDAKPENKHEEKKGGAA